MGAAKSESKENNKGKFQLIKSYGYLNKTIIF